MRGAFTAVTPQKLTVLAETKDMRCMVWYHRVLQGLGLTVWGEQEHGLPPSQHNPTTWIVCLVCCCKDPVLGTCLLITAELLMNGNVLVGACKVFLCANHMLSSHRSLDAVPPLARLLSSSDLQAQVSRILWASGIHPSQSSCHLSDDTPARMLLVRVLDGCNCV